MTDKELLELAAKAANDKNIREDYHGSHFRVIGECEDGSLRMVNWNPLIDDGDALRLTVKLNISISMNILYVSATTIGLTLTGIFIKEDLVGDWNGSATRRAIVRAAAEIGKGMK